MDQVAPTSSIVCILNGRARSHAASQMTARIGKLFSEHGAMAELVVVRRGHDITSIARRLVQEGHQMVVAGGGDGTISAVAAALVGMPISLGILPLGTLNHFAKDLGIPLDLEEAIVNILTGEPVQVDVGDVNGRVFVNNSSIGLYPAIVQERSDRQSRGYSKWVAFIQAVYSVLRRCPSFHASLHADGVSKGGDRTPFVFVGNNRYETSGLRIGERRTISDGRLWVCRAPGADRAVLLRMAVQAALGHSSPGDLKVLEAEELWVQSKGRRLKVANDGEVQSFTSPLHYRILPGALRVIVPPKAGTEDA